mmetsp:Transcript_169728/g.544700  ORF Transcript_169728/g.544700 Transcript_169728/m.544700 type:complete len:249 (-) Transcript_169728:268-1014(-)
MAATLSARLVSRPGRSSSSPACAEPWELLAAMAVFAAEVRGVAVKGVEPRCCSWRADQSRFGKRWSRGTFCPLTEAPPEAPAAGRKPRSRSARRGAAEQAVPEEGTASARIARRPPAAKPEPAAPMHESQAAAAVATSVTPPGTSAAAGASAPQPAAMPHLSSAWRHQASSTVPLETLQSAPMPHHCAHSSAANWRATAASASAEASASPTLEQCMRPAATAASVRAPNSSRPPAASAVAAESSPPSM